MLDIEQAALLAQRFLNEEAGPGGMTLAVAEGSTLKSAQSFTSQSFVEPCMTDLVERLVPDEL